MPQASYRNMLGMMSLVMFHSCCSSEAGSAACKQRRIECCPHRLVDKGVNLVVRQAVAQHQLQIVLDVAPGLVLVLLHALSNGGQVHGLRDDAEVVGRLSAKTTHYVNIQVVKVDAKAPEDW